jgi:hypothetical protein
MNGYVGNPGRGFIVLTLLFGVLGAAHPAAANCPCDADVDNDGFIRPQDQFCVQNCFQFGQCLCCQSSCDVNCDGSVNPQDVNAIQCMVDVGDPAICCPKVSTEPCCLPGSHCQDVPLGQCGADGGTVVDHCPLDGRCVPPADDCFTTQCGRTLFDFCNDPIPAGFFAPSSEPFSGIIFLGGPNDGLPDTVVRRFDAMLLDGPPETVPIELVSLNLVSCSPITVTIGTTDTLWNVAVDLSPAPNPPQPPGGMLVTKQHPNGGTFEAQFHVLPRFTFTMVNPPQTQKILDFDVEGRPPTLFETTGTPNWVHNPTVPVSPPPCGAYFVPGIQETETSPGVFEQCCTETCHANPGGGHDHCTETCSVCPTGACCIGGACTVTDGAGDCPGEYKGDGTNCEDDDGDGLANWFENNACCQSSTACSAASSPTDSDSDDDGINDGTEVSMGCNPCDSADCVFVPCCLPSSSCQTLLDVDCAAAGGTQVSHCPFDGRCVPPDDDCFTTECGRTLFDFCNDPIPADFFAPSSEPFTGVIILGGPNDGLPDTIVRRFDAMLLDLGPETIPIELVSLSLVSCQPITVDPGPTFWDVSVRLSADPVPPGSMMVTKQHPNGGVFNAQFNVLPRFIFTEVGNPGNQKVLDFGVEGIPPTLFETTGEPKWVHNPTVSIPFLCGVNFIPGIQETETSPGVFEQCCTETCHANPGGGHDHCTKTCNVCPTGACCLGGTCTVVDGAGNCPGEYKGDGTNCDDSDGDNIPDWLEINDCCQISTACSVASNPNNPDTDGDGINDGAEVAAGCDPCVANDCIPAGDDCFATSCGDTSFDFCETPIPADFFDPGSEPFRGDVLLQGLNGPPAPDTFMRRLGGLSLPNVGDAGTVPIELVSLSLVSCSPITVVNVPPPDAQWNVAVDLSPTPAPPGSMTVRKTHPNGGVFNSDFRVQPRFTFTRTTPPFDQRVFDTGAEGIPPATLGAVGSSPWVRTPSVAVQPLCGTFFAPGVEGDPANLLQCQSATECCVPIGHAGPGHLHVTGESCGPCPCGACCKPDGSCDQLEGFDPAGQCAAMGGTYGGDGTTCGDSDADGLADWFEKSDCCVPGTTCRWSTDPNNPDTDGDGDSDGTEIANGTDPCVLDETFADIIWDPNNAATRSLRINVVPPVVATGPGTSAIKVTMVDLENPSPPNNNPAGPCCPPGNFTTFDTAMNSVCAGGADQGYRCPPSACPGSACPAPVGCTEAFFPGPPQQGSCARWVGQPLGYLESNDNPGLGNYRVSRVQCAPFYYDWTAEPNGGLVNIIGAEIVPSSTYQLQNYGATCKGSESTCADVSPIVLASTRRAGDISTPFQGAPPLTQPNAIDVTNAVNKFRNLAGAPVKVIAQVQPNFPDPNADINAIDIVTVVDNQRGFGYTYSGPCVCPSTVPCNTTACAGASACTGLYGAGATCIKTCTSGRTGQPCNNNLNCGFCVGGPATGAGAAGIPCDANGDCASGTCQTGVCPTGATPGFCRDRCGRCN